MCVTEDSIEKGEKECAFFYNLNVNRMLRLKMLTGIKMTLLQWQNSVKMGLESPPV